jgi:hypothetical protein
MNRMYHTHNIVWNSVATREGHVKVGLVVN